MTNIYDRIPLFKRTICKYTCFYTFDQTFDLYVLPWLWPLCVTLTLTSMCYLYLGLYALPWLGPLCITLTWASPDFTRMYMFCLRKVISCDLYMKVNFSLWHRDLVHACNTTLLNLHNETFEWSNIKSHSVWTKLDAICQPVCHKLSHVSNINPIFPSISKFWQF